MNVIEASGLVKTFGKTRALDGFDMQVPKGRIVGLIGPNGSGKTTALKSVLGLMNVDEGTLAVLGQAPHAHRAELMGNVAFIADTGILPKWMRVRDLLDYVQGVHPNFDRAAALERLSRTQIHQANKIRTLSKGMHVQLHLAVILAIDAGLLVLDEPTLGLDILYRQQFYDAVLNDFFTHERSIVVTTHEVREIEHILTDVVFIHRGRAVLATSMEDIASDFAKLISPQEQPSLSDVLAHKHTINGHEYLLRRAAAGNLEQLGDVQVPNLAELFVAIVEAHP